MRALPVGGSRGQRDRIAKRSPRGSAGRLDQLDQHAVAGARVKERHRALRPAPWGAVDELDALDPQAGELFREVADLEADVVEALAGLFQEAGHPGRVVGRLDELDLGA